MEIVDTNKAADKESARAALNAAKAKWLPWHQSPRKDIMEFARYTYRNEWTKADGQPSNNVAICDIPS